MTIWASMFSACEAITGAGSLIATIFCEAALAETVRKGGK